jgi:hypothetical protein
VQTLLHGVCFKAQWKHGLCHGERGLHTSPGTTATMEGAASRLALCKATDRSTPKCSSLHVSSRAMLRQEERRRQVCSTRSEHSPWELLQRRATPMGMSLSASTVVTGNLDGGYCQSMSNCNSCQWVPRPAVISLRGIESIRAIYRRLGTVAAIAKFTQLLISNSWG